MEEKYIDLLLKRCLNFDKSKSLFISCDKVNRPFVDKVITCAKSMGVDDIFVDETDIYLTHDKLEKESLEEIKNDPYFNKESWNVYARRNASFLMFESEFPHMMDDIDPKKVAMARTINRTTREVFREKEITYQIPWCIAALPNEVWARDLFGNFDTSYDKLFDVIFKMCMVDTENPINSWDEYLKKVKVLSSKLNDLKIKSMHYTNGLGTDLYVEMPINHIWNSAASDGDLGMFVNMPSYEIFSSPNYLKTNGVVYSSKPLVYGGGLIDKFFVEFRDGKVINYGAEKGLEILKDIIETDDNSCYLGEVALVNNDSPISNTNLVFGTTLFDENASCHLALGDGFADCIKDGLNMTKDELLKHGINQSRNHVDFMIGTSDLKIEAETSNGKVLIFKDGNFNI